MALVHSPVGHWALRLLVDICEVSVHRLFCPSGAGQSLKPTQCISLPVSVSSPSCWCLAPELCPATSCLCPALTSGVKLTHPGDAFGQIMLLCTRHIIGRIPGAAFAPRMVFLLVQKSLVQPASARPLCFSCALPKIMQALNCPPFI